MIFRKTCEVCGVEFTSNSGVSKRCSECQKEHAKTIKKERSRISYLNKKLANPHPDIFCIDCGKRVPYVQHKVRCDECQEEYRSQWLKDYRLAHIEKVKAYQKEYYRKVVCKKRCVK